MSYLMSCHAMSCHWSYHVICHIMSQGDWAGLRPVWGCAKPEYLQKGGLGPIMELTWEKSELVSPSRPLLSWSSRPSWDLLFGGDSGVDIRLWCGEGLVSNPQEDQIYPARRQIPGGQVGLGLPPLRKNRT